MQDFFFAGVKEHPYTANLENLKKIFANTSISNGDSYRGTSYDEDDNDLGDENEDCKYFPDIILNIYRDEIF